MPCCGGTLPQCPCPVAAAPSLNAPVLLCSCALRYHTVRIDGSTSVEDRQHVVDNFNNLGMGQVGVVPSMGVCQVGVVPSMGVAQHWTGFVLLPGLVCTQAEQNWTGFVLLPGLVCTQAEQHWTGFVLLPPLFRFVFGSFV